jgi:hypothetical protein
MARLIGMRSGAGSSVTAATGLSDNIRHPQCVPLEIDGTRIGVVGDPHEAARHDLPASPTRASISRRI